MTPALGAVVNAIVDALAELGVEHIELPATPERVWPAMGRPVEIGGPHMLVWRGDATSDAARRGGGAPMVLAPVQSL